MRFLLIIINKGAFLMDLTKAAAGFGLLADQNRLHILTQLSREGEQSAAQLLAALPVSQPTLSHHMKLLWEGGLVRRRRVGQRVMYQVDRAALGQLLAVPLGEAVAEALLPPQPDPAQRASVIVRTGHKW